MGRVIAAFAQFFDNAGDPLEDGWLRFLESGTNNTNKDTFSDSAMQIPNSNPVRLDGDGRCPSIFGTGDYRVVSYLNDPDDDSNPGDQLQVFDPVTAEGTITGGTGTSFDDWDVSVTYGLGTIVSYNTVYYRSLLSSNLGNNPAVSTASWERVDFVLWWNADVNYSQDDMVYYEGNLYFSLQNTNLNNQPDVSSSWWVPVLSTELIPSDQYAANIYFPSGGDIGTALLPVTNLYSAMIYTADMEVTTGDLTLTAGDLILTAGDIILTAGGLQIPDDVALVFGTGGALDDGRIKYRDADDQLAIQGGTEGIVFADGFASDAWEIDFSGTLRPSVSLARNIGSSVYKVGASYIQAMYGNSLMSLGTGTAGWLKIGLHEDELDEDYFHIINMNDNGGVGPFQLQIYYNGTAYTLESV